jgi:hypothetical protein
MSPGHTYVMPELDALPVEQKPGIWMHGLDDPQLFAPFSQFRGVSQQSVPEPVGEEAGFASSEQ